MFRRMNRLILPLLIVTMTLNVSCSEDDSITATELPEIPNSTLELFLGEWQLRSINVDSGAIEEPPTPVFLNLVQSVSEPRIFEYQGTATCNVYAGNLFLFSEEVLLIDDLLTTEMLCDPETLNTFETSYYDIIQQSNSYRITQETLALTTEDGRSANFIRVVTSL